MYKINTNSVKVSNEITQLALIHAHESYCINDYCIKIQQSNSVKQQFVICCQSPLQADASATLSRTCTMQTASGSVCF